MPQCYVKSCNNYYGKTRGSTRVIYHMLPMSSSLAMQWAKACGNKKGDRPPPYVRVCSDHFSPDCYQRDLQHELLGLPLRRKLKPGAVPNQNLPTKASVKDKSELPSAVNNNAYRVNVKVEVSKSKSNLKENHLAKPAGEIVCAKQPRSRLLFKDPGSRNSVSEPSTVTIPAKHKNLWVRSSGKNKTEPSASVKKNHRESSDSTPEETTKPTTKPNRLPMRSSIRIAKKKSIESLSDSFTLKVNSKGGQNNSGIEAEQFSDKLRFMAKLHLRYERTEGVLHKEKESEDDVEEMSSRPISATETLISEVQGRNVLWNKKNSRYKDRLIVDREWNAVANSTGFSKEEVKRKWKNLRDRFTKELKKVRKLHSDDVPDEDEGQYTGKWQYFHTLYFLRGIVAPRHTEGNAFPIEVLKESQTSSTSTEDIEDEDSSVENSTTSVASSSQASVTTDVPRVITKDSVSQLNTNSSGLQVSKEQQAPVSDSINTPILSSRTSSRSKRKKIHEEDMDIDEKLLNIETKKLVLPETPEDENSLFLTSLLPYFKKMDPLQQLRVRNKFKDILIQEMSPQSTNFHPCNIYFPVRPASAVSSVPSSTYSILSSPASPAEAGYSATELSNIYPNTDFSEIKFNY